MNDETLKNENNQHSGEHEYDGIVELNNPAPRWVILIFLVTICFAMIYAIKYFGYPNNGKDQSSEYKQTMAEVEAAKSTAKNGGKVVMDEAQMIEAGKKLFSDKGCIACHGANGEGNAIGPNLTDNNWINGCSEDNVVGIITNGKPEKGMSSFKTMMTEDQIKQVATFVLKSLKGSKPANPKAPQGDECK